MIYTACLCGGDCSYTDIQTETLSQFCIVNTQLSVTSCFSVFLLNTNRTLEDFTALVDKYVLTIYSFHFQ